MTRPEPNCHPDPHICNHTLAERRPEGIGGPLLLCTAQQRQQIIRHASPISFQTSHKDALLWCYHRIATQRLCLSGEPSSVRGLGFRVYRGGLGCSHPKWAEYCANNNNKGSPGGFPSIQSLPVWKNSLDIIDEIDTAGERVK